MDFILNITASLIAGALLLLVVSLVSQWARWMLTAVLGRILDVDVEYVFANKTAAMADLQRDVKRASELHVFASRGNELQREPFTTIFHERPKDRKVKVRILLPKTKLSKREYDWTAQRERELTEFDPSFGAGLLHTQVETNVNFLAPYVTSNTVELRRFNSPHIGRVILTDRCVYYTPYRSDSHGRDSRVYKYRRGGDTYANFMRLFEQLWAADEPHPQSNHETTESHNKAVNPSGG